MSQLILSILLVDRKDSEFLRSAVRIFDEAGFNVDFCSDWDSLQRKLKFSVRAIDFLLIDLACFQTRDAYLSLVELRERARSKDQKIILTTNTLVEEILRRKRRELGIVATFNKTRNIEELFCILTNSIFPTGRNQRRIRRIPARFLVHYTVNGMTEVFCARNLSRAGIFVQKHNPDPVGTLVQLSFILPGQESIFLVRARVARASSGSYFSKQEAFPPGNGLEFTEISEADAHSLKEYTDCEELRIFGCEEGANQPVALEEHGAPADLSKTGLQQDE